MRLAPGYLRLAPVRTSALVAGIAAAAAAFTVLCMNAAAPTVQVRGSLPAVSPQRSYDILVRVPSRVDGPSTGAAPVRPTDLAELSGGITLAQYETISKLPGVQVAAPMTMIGYVPLTVTIPITVPSSALTTMPALFTLTATQRTDAGLSAITLHNIASTYVSTYSSDVVSVPLQWTFLLPLVAVDPAAEARLLHLNRAITRGSYLPATKVSRSGQVPVIIASSIDDDAQDELSVARLPASAARRYAFGLTASQLSSLLGTTTGQPVSTTTVTATQAYQKLLGYLDGSGTARVTAYLTPSLAHYTVGADGSLTPEPVATNALALARFGEEAGPGAAAAAADTGFRALTAHVAIASGARPAGTVLRAVGVFDPARIASSAATPSPYRGEQLVGANARSRRLLGGKTLEPDGNPAGYPSPGATLVMPLQDIGAFTAAGAYSGTDAAAPIGSIRVRVAGVTGDDPVSQERVRMVAQEIVRATGLPVDVTLAASAATRTIDLAAGRDGRPALELTEVWYRSDTWATVSTRSDPRSIALSALVLLIGAAFIASGSAGVLRTRRRDLATLRALGWRRRQLAWQLTQEFTMIAVAAGLLAVAAAYALEAGTTGRATSGWPLLSLPAAVTMTLTAAWWPVRHATAETVLRGSGLAKTAVPGRDSSGVSTARPGSGEPERPVALPWLLLSRRPLGVLDHAVRSTRSAPLRTLLGVSVIVIACAALGLELSVRWVFGGAVVGSWLGLPVSWQSQPVDIAAVITLLAMATIAMTDMSWLAAADSSSDLRTLRAIGWSARGVARLAAGEALLLGAVGGGTAGILDVACVFAVVHGAPAADMVAVGGIVVAVGAVMSLVAFALSAVAARTSTTTAHR